MHFLSDYTVDWQQVVILLYALNQMPGDVPSRSRTMEFIQRESLLQYREGDNIPYPTSNEPSWMTDMAWARKDAVIAGYVHNDEWDSWQISRDGRNFLKRVEDRCRDESLSVYRCSLWAKRLKRLFFPSYEPSPHDSAPPPKGERTIPSLGYYQRLIDERLQSSTITELAQNISAKLGVSVPATKPSVAFAYHRYIMSIL